MPTYTIHSDPGHAWLAVPLADLARSGFVPSRFSPADGETAYLEEDCDAPGFLAAEAAAGRVHLWETFPTLESGKARELREEGRTAFGMLEAMRRRARLDRKNQARRDRDQAYRDCGLTKVRGSQGGTFWE